MPGGIGGRWGSSVFPEITNCDLQMDEMFIFGNAKPEEMKTHYLLTLAVGGAIFLLASCGGAGNKDNNTTQTDTSTLNQQPEAPVITSAVFEIKVNEGDEPTSEIYVKAGDQRIGLDTIPGSANHFAVEEYKEMGIPADALDACGGWWAGGGDYYYLVKTATGVDIYAGWLDEMQEDQGYHWKKVKSL